MRFPFKRWRGPDGRMRAKHDDIMNGMRTLAKSIGWTKKPDDGGWSGPVLGQRLSFL